VEEEPAGGIDQDSVKLCRPLAVAVVHAVLIMHLTPLDCRRGNYTNSGLSL